MAVTTRTPPRTTAAPAQEITTAGYFRALFEANPAWLKQSTADILNQYQLDNPGKPITNSVKTALAKTKAKMRSGGAKKRTRAGTIAVNLARPAAAQPSGQVSVIVPMEPASFPVRISGRLTMEYVQIGGRPCIKAMAP